MSFGYCEFETVEGVLRCLRIMNNMKLLNNQLQIKPSEKTETYLKEWNELKKKEWLHFQTETSKCKYSLILINFFTYAIN